MTACRRCANLQQHCSSYSISLRGITLVSFDVFFLSREAERRKIQPSISKKDSQTGRHYKKRRDLPREALNCARADSNERLSRGHRRTSVCQRPRKLLQRRLPSAKLLKSAGKKRPSAGKPRSALLLVRRGVEWQVFGARRRTMSGSVGSNARWRSPSGWVS